MKILELNNIELNTLRECLEEKLTETNLELKRLDEELSILCKNDGDYEYLETAQTYKKDLTYKYKTINILLGKIDNELNSND